MREYEIARKKKKRERKPKTQLEYRKDSFGEEGQEVNCNLIPWDGLRSQAPRFSEPVSNMNLVAVFLSPGSCIIYLA